MIDTNQWAFIAGKVEAGTFTVRFRKPDLWPEDTGIYSHRLTVTWPYAEGGTGAMPDDADDKAMRVFEERLIKAWEHDYTALLTAVVTFDGTRQWIFYARDVDECRKRIGEMQQEVKSYLIELITDEDPAWRYLKSILFLVPWEGYQEEWQKSLIWDIEQTGAHGRS